MRNFYPQIVPLSPQTLTLGGSVTFPVNRESLIAGLQLNLEGNVNTIATTVPVEGLPKLVKSITLRGSIGGGATVEVCSGVSGPDMFEAAQFQTGMTPFQFGSLGATGRFRVTIPIWLREFFLSSEVKNLMTALPAYAMSDLNLTIQFSSQAELGGGLVLDGTPQAFVNVLQYYRDSIPDGLPFIRSLYEVQESGTIVTGSNTEFKLPSGGLYAYTLARAFSGSNTKQANSGTAPFSSNPVSGGFGITLYDLSRFAKIQSDYLSLRAQNLQYVVDSLIDGNVCLLHNRGEANLFQTGQLGRALNNVLITAATAAATNANIRFVSRRILDDANAYQIQF